MLKIIKTKNFSKVFCVILLFLFFLIHPVLAIDSPDKGSGFNPEKYGLEKTSDMAEIPKNQDPAVIIGKIIGALLSFLGIVFFVLIIYGGFQWMTAGGNEEQVNKAIDMIKSAIIGLIIIMAAYLITRYIGEQIFNAAGGQG